MPPRGIEQGTKRARQYEHIKESAKSRGASEDRAEELAARTVNRERARAGESQSASRLSTSGASSSSRGGRRAHQQPTKQELYEQAKRVGIEGRSRMTKEQLKRALARKRG
jgi:hypothetical protein